MMDRLLHRVDHLVYSTPDLERTVSDLERRLGVRAAPGGQHPGRGTRNALIALSSTAYLEVIGPDPFQPGTGSPRWFGIDTINAPRLVTWAARGTALEELAIEARRRGVSLGPVAAGSRHNSEGRVLMWQFTDPAVVVADGLVPFFIDWGESPHPATASPRGPALLSLRGEHPEPASVLRALSAVGIDLPVEHGSSPALIAILQVKEGEVELR
jgi:hypothetical protein